MVAILFVESVQTMQESQLFLNLHQNDMHYRIAQTIKSKNCRLTVQRYTCFSRGENDELKLSLLMLDRMGTNHTIQCVLSLMRTILLDTWCIVYR